MTWWLDVEKSSVRTLDTLHAMQIRDFFSSHIFTTAAQPSGSIRPRHTNIYQEQRTHEMPAPLYASSCIFCTSWFSLRARAADRRAASRRPSGSRSQPPGAAAAIR